jgi:hypothetical protein
VRAYGLVLVPVLVLVLVLVLVPVLEWGQWAPKISC